MCIFAKFANIDKQTIKPQEERGLLVSCKKVAEKIFGPIDMINFISLHFALIGAIVLFSGWYFANHRGLIEIIGDSYTGWLGILIDAMLLYFINWAIRREEREKLIDQFGSESNAFALDATKRLRKKGWLLDGALSGIDMGHAQLDRANLTKAQLKNIDFTYASMKDSILVEADFSGANLTGVDFTGAECRWANFSGANLRWANLEGASLDGVNFDGADLRFAKFSKLNKETISMEGALLSENLTDEEVALVQGSTQMIRKSTEEFSMAFYEELFKVNPLVKKLFLSNIRNQAVKFAQLFELLTASLNNMEKLIPALRALGKRHVNYGINETHYGIVGGALINTLDNSLGTDFTPQIKEAWLKTYGLVTMVMIDSGKGLL